MIAINQHAPVTGRAVATIGVPADRVWEILTAIDAWPRWNPEVKAARINGAVTVGTAFRWKAQGSSVVSTLREVDAPHRLAWTGRSMGVSAIHTWALAESDGITTLTTEESMQGAVARVLRRPLQKMLDRSLQAWVAALTAEAER